MSLGLAALPGVSLPLDSCQTFFCWNLGSGASIVNDTAGPLGEDDAWEVSPL